MILKKTIIWGIPILLLFVVTVFFAFNKSNMPPEKALNKFSKLIEKKNLDDISLTIYYMNLDIFTFAALSVDDLIKFNAVQKFVIDSNSLEEHIDLLKQLNKDALIPSENKSYINARIYYVFKTKKNRKIFDVIMWGSYGSVFINGLEVKGNDIFYYVIMPFLPEDETKKLETYRQGNQEDWINQ